MTKLMTKFISMLKEKGLEVDEDSFRRTYAGINQRSAGAWLWFMTLKERPKDFGSSWPVTELVKRGFTVEYSERNYEIELYPIFK